MPPLASAYLALTDDDTPLPQRTIPRMLACAAASVVLAIGAPLGFVVLHPGDNPVGPLSTKLSLADDE